MLLSSSSAWRVLRQLFGGRPLFLLPCGFQSKACLGICSGLLRSVWPTQLHFLTWILFVMGSCFDLCKSSSFEIRSGHLMRRICLRHLFIKTWSLLSRYFVRLQVSEPYNSTDLTFVLKRRSLVWVLRFSFFHTGLRAANALLALQILVLISSSAPPVLLIILPR